MDWLPTLLDVIFVAGQVFTCLGLACGGFLSVRYSGVASFPGETAASRIPGGHGQTPLWMSHAVSS
jgi:hypothetical protein